MLMKSCKSQFTLRLVLLFIPLSLCLYSSCLFLSHALSISHVLSHCISLSVPHSLGLLFVLFLTLFGSIFLILSLSFFAFYSFSSPLMLDTSSTSYPHCSSLCIALSLYLSCCLFSYLSPSLQFHIFKLISKALDHSIM